MSNTKVTLYHANWCGHCKNFMPTWNALKNVFGKNNIEHAEYESDANSKEVQKAGVQGFPTIRITQNNKTYDYNGPRTPDGLINEVLPNLQKGGGSVRRYEVNYTGEGGSTFLKGVKNAIIAQGEASKRYRKEIWESVEAKKKAAAKSVSNVSREGKNAIILKGVNLDSTALKVKCAEAAKAEKLAVQTPTTPPPTTPAPAPAAAQRI